MGGNYFTCYVCKHTFETDRTEEEAEAEYAEFLAANPGRIREPEKRQVLCTACYRAVRAWWDAGGKEGYEADHGR